MKKIIAVAVALLVVGVVPSEAASAPKSGSKCKKVGITQTSGGKKYTCIKLGSSLYWNNGVKISKSSQVQSPSVPLVTPAPQAPVSQVPQIPCGYGSAVPNAASNIVVRWENDDLIISLNWDQGNKNFVCPITELTVEITADGLKRESRAGYGTFLLTPNASSQVLKVTKQINREINGIFNTRISEVCVRAYDKFFNKSEYVCAQEVPQYKLNLAPPVITVTPASNGYEVDYATPDASIFDAIQIVEFVSSEITEPTGVEYSAVYWDKKNPAEVISQNLSPRWIKARFSTKAGIWTEYSKATKVTPMASIQVR